MKFRTVALIASLSLLSVPSFADWSLNNNASSLFYVSSKASAVSEVNSFSQLSGSIDNAGNATLNIELSSVETAIDIRNQRVRDMLFQITSYPQATASLSIDVESLDSMPAGLSVIGNYQVELDLHGITETLDAEIQITKLTNNNLQVQLAKPLIINAATYGLEGGVEELREVAGLASINNNVVVDFTLLFEL